MTDKKGFMASYKPEKTLSVGDRHLRTSILFAVAVHGLFIIFFTVFLFKHLPASLPAYLARWDASSSSRPFLVLIASFLYFGLWLEFLDELSIQPAHWKVG
jgi:hypothetical protein